MNNSSNLLGTSVKPPGEISNDSVDKDPSNKVVIVPSKPNDGSRDSDADMSGGDHDTSTSPLNYDYDTLTAAKSVVISTGDPAWLSNNSTCHSLEQDSILLLQVYDY